MSTKRPSLSNLKVGFKETAFELFDSFWNSKYFTLDYFELLKRNLHLFFSFLFLEIKTDMARLLRDRTFYIKEYEYTKISM